VTAVKPDSASVSEILGRIIGFGARKMHIVVENYSGKCKRKKVIRN
jgi:hypothetical protein